jgi:hypothetical protein
VIHRPARSRSQILPRGTRTRFLGWYQPGIGHPLFSSPPFDDGNGHQPHSGGRDRQASIELWWGADRSIDSGVPFGKGMGLFGRPDSVEMNALSRSPRTRIQLCCRNLSSRRGCRTGVRGTSGRCGGDLAEQVAGDVEKREAPAFFRHCIEIRLDENLDGLYRWHKSGHERAHRRNRPRVVVRSLVE